MKTSPPDKIPLFFWRQCQGIIAAYVTLHLVYAALHKAHFFKAVVTMPRRKGFANYKNSLLVDIVPGIMPSNELGWESVAHVYHKQLKEKIVRDLSDLKSNGSRHGAME